MKKLLLLAAFLLTGCTAPMTSDYLVEKRSAASPFDNVKLETISQYDEVTIYRLDSYKDGHRIETPLFTVSIPHVAKASVPDTQPVKK